jgi:hypothetical protein
MGLWSAGRWYPGAGRLYISGGMVRPRGGAAASGVGVGSSLFASSFSACGRVEGPLYFEYIFLNRGCGTQRC